MKKPRRKSYRAKKLKPKQVKRDWLKQKRDALYLKKAVIRVKKKYCKGKKPAYLVIYIDLNPRMKGNRGILHYNTAKGDVIGASWEIVLIDAVNAVHRNALEPTQQEIIIKDYNNKTLNKIERIRNG